MCVYRTVVHAGRPLDVYINMNINDISSISEMRMVSLINLHTLSAIIMAEVARREGGNYSYSYSFRQKIAQKK